MFTAGFREVGEAGARLEQELVEIAEAHGIVLCGPNCIGVVNRHTGLMASFASSLQIGELPPGPVGFVSQSGMFVSLAIVEQVERRLGVGTLVSVGNEAGIEIADVIAHYAGDPAIKVIASYMEGARDGRKLSHALAMARAAGKRVVILKVGRSEESARAARSHTGSLTGDYRVYRSIFAANGVIEAEGLEDFFDLIEASVHVPAVAPAGDGPPRIAVFGNSGGLGVLVADKVRESGLALADFTEATQSTLREHLPPFIHPVNPVDLALQHLEAPHVLPRYLEALLSDPNVEGILAIFGLYRPKTLEFAEAILAAAASSSKPFVFACPHTAAEFTDCLSGGGVPVFRTPERAIRALRSLYRRPATMGTTPQLSPSTRAELNGLVSGHAGRTTLSEGEGMQLVAALDVPVGRIALAEDSDAAVRIAETVGGPAVLKVESADLPHKTEVGAVALGLEGADQIRAAHDRILAAVRMHRPDAAIEGVAVHRMVPDARELLLGVRRDPAFGPVALVGAGGTAAEVLDDVALMPAPVTVEQAGEMICSLRTFPLLNGARSRTPSDVQAAAAALSALSALADAFPQIGEIEVNPLFVAAEGDGVVAGDVLAILNPDVPASG
jgi:acetyltransferase